MVSPAAPSHHFGDSRGLLTAVAAKGFRKLTDQLNSALQKATKQARLEAVGEAYLEFAKRNPALFTMMWTRDLLDQSDPDYLAAARAAGLTSCQPGSSSLLPVLYLRFNSSSTSSKLWPLCFTRPSQPARKPGA